MRAKVTYNEAELKRTANYIIVSCDRNIDTHIVDIEEATNYVNVHKRRAIIVSNKAIFKNKPELGTLKYNFIMNATSPAVKLIDHNGQIFKNVYNYLNTNYKNGLIVCHDDTLTNEIAEMLSLNKNNGLDFLVYRQDLLQLSANERGRMNFIRFHANSEFIFSKDMFQTYIEKFGQNIAIGIFVSQMIVNYQYRLCQQYFEEHSEKFKTFGFSDYIDYYELNKQSAYYVYYDTFNSKILEMPKEKIQFYIELVAEAISDKVMFNKAEEWSVLYS